MDGGGTDCEFLHSFIYSFIHSFIHLSVRPSVPAFFYYTCLDSFLFFFFFSILFYCKYQYNMTIFFDSIVALKRAFGVMEESGQRWE